MKIAILGWGSLIWNPDILKLDGRWTPGGPTLPIEFSRISDNGRLTLVIDERDGIDTVTYYGVSALTKLNAAIDNLQKREGTPNRNRIGFVDLPSRRMNDLAAKHHPKAYERIHAWAARKNFDAVIWTAIGPRFLEKRSEVFSPDAALRYVESLEKPTKANALDYIFKAPAEIKTPTRSKIELAFKPSPP